MMSSRLKQLWHSAGSITVSWLLIVINTSGSCNKLLLKVQLEVKKKKIHGISHSVVSHFKKRTTSSKGFSW